NSAAILLTGSSSFLFLTLVTKKENTKWLIYCLLGLLLALAYLIRSKALIGTFIFLTPAIFIYMLYSKVRFNKGWVFFIIPLLLGVSAHKMYITFCTDHQYKNFIEWNSGRGKFHDFHIQELQRNNTEFFQNSDWSRLDYELLDEWYIFDENIFNTRSINQLLDYPVPQELILSSQLDLTASKLMRYDWHNFISICTLVISAIALVSMLKTKNTGLLSRLNLYYFLLVGAAMTYFMRFPERIAFPFAYITLLSILALANLDSFHSTKITKLKKCLVSTLLAFSIVLYFYNFTHNIKEDKREIDTFYRGNTLLNHYIDRYNYVAMYPSNANLKWQFTDPLKVYNENFISIPGGWPAFSPRFYSSINDLDLNHGHELFPRIVNGEHVLVIATRYRISLLTQYLSVQLGIECEVEYKGSIGNFANMYELHPATK
ncbi:MAG: hypothetical protein P1U70_27970, partial [Saprospiraceae bacterium]|nr:hypothetical protein [Saprospiraceae bacterium]